MPFVDENQNDQFQEVFSYATLDYADDYLNSKLSTKTIWATFSDEDKTCALREATLNIDAAFPYVGRKVYVAQVREWPRYLDLGSIGDVFYLQTLILPDIANACVEQAYFIAKNVAQGHDHKERMEHQFQGLSGINRAGAGENYNLGKARRHELCRAAYQLMNGYVARTGNLRDAYDPNANRRTTY